ncbi:MAG: hypothetical protein ACHP6H_01615 [Legionellales bacterium]
MTMFKDMNPFRLRKNAIKNDRMDKFTPEQITEMNNKYREYLHLNMDGIFNKEAKSAFDELVRNRYADPIQVMKEAKGPNGSDIYSKINGVPTLKNALNEALQLPPVPPPPAKPPAFQAAQQKYSRLVFAFEDLCKQIPPLKAEALCMNLITLIDDAKNALKNQQNQEVANLNALFDPSTAKGKAFRDEMKVALVLTPPGDDDAIDEIKNNMLAELNNAHREEEKQLHEKLDAAHRNIHAAVAKQGDEMGFILMLMNQNKHFSKKVEALAKDKQASAASSGVTLGWSGNPNNPQGVKCNINGVTLKDIDAIESITGTTIKQEGKNGYSMHIRSRMFAPFYHADQRQNVKTDMLIMANLIKHSGHDKIVMQVGLKADKNDPHEFHRQAYEACRKAGYPPEKITIKDGNGAIIPHDEIFKQPAKSTSKYRDKSTIDNEANRLQPGKSAPLTSGSAKERQAAQVALENAAAAAPAAVGGAVASKKP